MSDNEMLEIKASILAAAYTVHELRDETKHVEDESFYQHFIRNQKVFSRKLTRRGE